MFVDVVLVHVMEVTIVEIIGMVLVSYCSVPTLGVMRVPVSSVFFACICHRIYSSSS
jgi:hypothetical protein